MAGSITTRRAPMSRSTRWVKLARDCNFNEQLIAERCMVSVRQLQRYFIDDLGRTPKSWLIEQRMIFARKLLISHGMSVKAASAQLGFKQVSHFCREFKRSYGMTPTQFVRLWSNVANLAA